jgi:hypothetical protein
MQVEFSSLESAFVLPTAQFNIFSERLQALAGLPSICQSGTCVLPARCSQYASTVLSFKFEFKFADSTEYL